jgi:hypothetical protein
MMTENRSGIPRIKYWKKISLWNFFNFAPKSPVFQSSKKKHDSKLETGKRANVL